MNRSRSKERFKLLGRIVWATHSRNTRFQQRRFQFEKRGQQFVRMNDVAPAVAFMRINDPAPAISGNCAAIAPRPAGRTELVSDDFLGYCKSSDGLAHQPRPMIAWLMASTTSTINFLSCRTRAFTSPDDTLTTTAYESSFLGRPKTRRDRIKARLRTSPSIDWPFLQQRGAQQEGRER